MDRTYIAFDVGATSGRTMVGRFDGERFMLEEINRFANPIHSVRGRLYWDHLALFAALREGVTLAKARYQTIHGMGVDTWGVDIALISKNGAVCFPPQCYRNEHFETMSAVVCEAISDEDLYAATGLQYLPFNTIYQLAALRVEEPELLAAADRFVFMSDLLAYLFGGELATDVSMASTSQLYDPLRRDWAWGVIDRLGLPRTLFPPIRAHGHVLGEYDGIPVYTVAGHDTGSAVAAVPTQDTPVVYISSGTWSLVGCELAAPVLTDAARNANFSNEQGVAGTTRLLKNITGMWLLEQCRMQWETEGHAISYDTLVNEAQAAETFVTLVNPNDPSFICPANMPHAIAAYAARTGQPVPKAPGAFTRVIFESLALSYRWALQELQTIIPFTINRVHIIGGGARNTMLNQWVANATGVPVIAGPTEATALGNLAAQAIADGALADWSSARAAIARSVDLATYQPSGEMAWITAAERFARLL